MKQGILLLTVGVMLLTGCSSVPTRDIQIETQANPKINFDGYTTYSWLGSAAILRDPSGQWEPPEFDADTEIRHLIDRELRKRGMLETTDNPDMIVTFGWVCRAHSSAMCEALRPMSLMKCQYFLAELASRSMLPISSA